MERLLEVVYEITKYSGAKDAILDCEWVIDEPERFKGNNEFLGRRDRFFLEVGMGKGAFSRWIWQDFIRREILWELRCMTVCFFGRCREGELEAAGRSFQSCFYPGGCKISAGDF